MFTRERLGELLRALPGHTGSLGFDPGGARAGHVEQDVAVHFEADPSNLGVQAARDEDAEEAAIEIVQRVERTRSALVELRSPNLEGSGRALALMRFHDPESKWAVDEAQNAVASHIRRSRLRQTDRVSEREPQPVGTVSEGLIVVVKMARDAEGSKFLQPVRSIELEDQPHVADRTKCRLMELDLSKSIFNGIEPSAQQLMDCVAPASEECCLLGVRHLDLKVLVAKREPTRLVEQDTHAFAVEDVDER